MLTPSWQGRCPSCGAPIEFLLGESRAKICSFCRHSVFRLGGDLSDLGKVADLAPTTPVLAVGDRGTIEGSPFVVLGRQQLDHGRGPWDELFVAFEDGRTAWLARAQGRWYLTTKQPAARPPAVATLSPGQRLSLPGLPDLEVAEVGRRRVVSAEGELPDSIRTDDTGAYADLSGAGGAFATIDDAEDGEVPAFFLGRKLEGNAVERTLSVGGGTTITSKVGKLSCAVCGSDVELRIPDSVERLTCPSCRALLDYEGGNLRRFAKAEGSRFEPRIPLGSKGTLLGEELVVVGYLRRSTDVLAITYSWDEYLLHGAMGFRWLMEENGHFTLFRELESGDVDADERSVLHEGRRYRLFNDVRARVDYVLGEFHWKVRAGDTVTAKDYVDAPNVVSAELSTDEWTWSFGTYVDGDEVWKAFAPPGMRPSRVGVGACQPNPVPSSFYHHGFALMALLFLAAFVLKVVQPSRQIYVSALPVAATPEELRAADEPEPVLFEAELVVPRGPSVLSFELDGTFPVNGYLSADVALLDPRTGRVREAELVAEHYSGYEGGEHWEEGDSHPVLRFDRVQAGTYELRVSTDWDYWPDPYRVRYAFPTYAPQDAPGDGSGAYVRDRPADAPNGTLVIRHHDPSGWNFGLALFALLVPLGFGVAIRSQFEKNRWENASVEPPGE